MTNRIAINTVYKLKADERTVSLNHEFEKILATLPLATYRAGETVLSAGTKSGRLLILRRGSVAVLNGSVEIARVDEPGVVFGEIAALLDLPHTANVRALEDTEFYVTAATLLSKEPAAVLHVAKVLARRIVIANKNLVEMKNQFAADRSPGVMSKMLGKLEEVLSIGGASFET